MPQDSPLNDDSFWDFERYRTGLAPTPPPTPQGEAGGEPPGPLPSATPREPTLDPAEAAARSFDPKPDYAADPGAWGRERLNEFYWTAQVEVLRSLVSHRYTAVKSCHDAGKSFIA